MVYTATAAYYQLQQLLLLLLLVYTTRNITSVQTISRHQPVRDDDGAPVFCEMCAGVGGLHTAIILTIVAPAAGTRYDYLCGATTTTAYCYLLPRIIYTTTTMNTTSYSYCGCFLLSFLLHTSIILVYIERTRVLC